MSKGITPEPKKVFKKFTVDIRRNSVKALKEMREIILTKIFDLLEEKKVSGTLIDSIKNEIIHSKHNVTLHIYSTTAYAMVVHEGRRAGSFPYVPAIRQWILDKSIHGNFNLLETLGLARSVYYIGKKIAEEGIPPFKFFQMALDETKPQLIIIANKYGFKWR